MKRTILIFGLFIFVIGLTLLGFLLIPEQVWAANITSISPSAVVPGETEVIISGSGFGNSQGWSKVLFNWTTAYSVGSWSDTQIKVKTPSSISEGNIKVKVCADAYWDCETIEGPEYYFKPEISSISPTTGKSGDTITIKPPYFSYLFGDFKGTVTFNGVSAQIISWKSYSIEAIVPSGASSGNIVVTSSSGISSEGKYFEVLQPPIITSISPISVIPGFTRMTIMGSRFGDKWYTTGGVYFGNIRAESVYLWSDTKIEVLVPGSITTSGRVSIKVSPFDLIYGPNYSIESPISNDSFSIYQKTHFELIKVPQAWNITHGSTNVVVAVIDDGIYINHPDLLQNIWQNTGEIVGNGIDDDNNGYIDDRLGWNFVYNGSEMTALGTHGTMVAGVIGAIGDNNQGIAGINWQVKLMSLIVCTSSGCSFDRIERAIKYAADNGADIINLSLSTFATIGYTTTLNEPIEYAYNKGVTIVAAAGNGDVEGGRGQDLNIIPQSPVCNDSTGGKIIGVGASDNDGFRPTWSNYGTDCVDIYAPGIDVVSTSVPAYVTLGDFYSLASGTSLSAPMVSGAAALLKAKYPTIPNYEIRNRIVTNSNSGILDVYAILNKPYSTPPTAPTVAYVYKDATKNTQLQWTTVSTNDDPTPYFEWSGASASAGISGYYVYFGQDKNADPVTNGRFQTAANYTPTNIMDAGGYYNDYYLKIATKDKIGQASGSSPVFTYRYNALADVQIREGSLIQCQTGACYYNSKYDIHAVYLIEDGYRRPFPSTEVLNALGYSLDDLISVDSETIDSYPLGEFMDMPVDTSNIHEGTLVRAIGGIDVYIVKYVGSKKFKRLVLSPTVFNSYGHLHWEDIMDIDRFVVSAFTTSNLVRATVAGDPRVYMLYPSGDTGEKRWVRTAEAFNRMGYDWDAIYTINETDRDSYIDGADIDTSTISASDNTIALEFEIIASAGKDTEINGINFLVESTDKYNTKWNHCGAGRLGDGSNFSLYDMTDTTTGLDATADWHFYQTNGSLVCSSETDLGFVQWYDASNVPLLVAAGTTRRFKLVAEALSTVKSDNSLTFSFSNIL